MAIELKQYTGTKTIHAAPMTISEAEKELGRSITLAADNTDGYLVIYPDGYRSWSPAKAFEDAYRVSETHVDRMIIELNDLNERICKATIALHTPGVIPERDRQYLRYQIDAMNVYAGILYDRIDYYVKHEPVAVATTAAPKEGALD